jgi:hypothetical protein
MIIRSNLFIEGHALSGHVSLSRVLENQKRKTTDQIKGISNLGQMTNAFLEKLIKESLVEPLAFQFGSICHKLRTERLDASYLPANTLAQNPVPGSDLSGHLRRLRFAL